MAKGFDFSFLRKLDLSKILRAEKEKEILVGFVESMPHSIFEGGVAELARVNSYGDSIHPARPFLEEGILDGLEAIKKDTKEFMEVVVSGGDSEKSAHKIGARAVGAVQEFVRGDYYQNNLPNSPRTIEAKGSDKPLIDTGQMINSVTYVIRENGK